MLLIGTGNQALPRRMIPRRYWEQVFWACGSSLRQFPVRTFVDEVQVTCYAHSHMVLRWPKFEVWVVHL